LIDFEPQISRISRIYLPRKGTKCAKTFENVRKRSKTFKNIQKYSNFEWKRSKIFKNIRLFLDADCAAKFSHRFHGFISHEKAQKN